MNEILIELLKHAKEVGIQDIKDGTFGKELQTRIETLDDECFDIYFDGLISNLEIFEDK